MPTPAHTSPEAIVAAARAILETEGSGALTMQAVAAAVGVRAPSLYKRLRDRNELLRLVGDAVAGEISDAAVAAAAACPDPRDRLRALVAAFRAYAHEHPAAYGLLFTRVADDARVTPAANARAVGPLLAAIADLEPGADPLPGARLVVAWLHGFLTMELNGAFRMGGDVDEAFEYGADRIVEAIASGRDGTRPGQ